MKKRNIVFFVLLGISILITIISLGFLMHGIPLQDPQYAPASAVASSRLNESVGDVLFAVGTLMFWGTIIWRIVIGIISRKNRRQMTV